MASWTRGQVGAHLLLWQPAPSLVVVPRAELEAADLMEISRAMRDAARRDDIGWIAGLCSAR